MANPLLGRDLALDYLLGAFREDADLIAGRTVGIARSDLALTEDADNLVQAVANRLKTRKGELAALGHPDYGSRHHELMGEPNVERTRNLIKFFVLQALRDEPRIERVLRADVRAEHTPPREIVRIELTHQADRRSGPAQSGRAVLAGGRPMTFVAEPFGLFVDDLLTGLTGGVVREGFRFLPEEAPFRLDPPAPLLRNTVRVHGISAGAHTVFRTGTDYVIGADDTVVWQQQADGSPRAGRGAARCGQPVLGQLRAPGPGRGRPAPDRSQSRQRHAADRRDLRARIRGDFGQLDAVYQAAFIDTAGGRDLDQLALLLGVTRVTASAASGSIVFARRTPSPADVSIPAGTRVSTSDAPPTLFETTEARTLRRGEISVEAPIRALVAGRGGIVPAGAIGVLHRPLLGIESVTNPQATAFATAAEDDAALRARLRRRLEARARRRPVR